MKRCSTSLIIRKKCKSKHYGLSPHMLGCLFERKKKEKERKREEGRKKEKGRKEEKEEKKEGKKKRKTSVRENEGKPWYTVGGNVNW